ncbi:tripartite tricarboxylate transporter TctB family protein [Marinovum sp. 2_MG-2023]|uniref:tripartite tricarboxylate transporter TctB family protein n=1 Tax=unclassified Marinovum TaxID=2647166 RepID=UPI0026E46275|nr:MULTISPECIES: tripartite tricarboxylate transporter TctB family protein [unclassified Marinovum]MDO6732803.1 tripartite tricarboxylate transporter TctB family protein [Marinovum sp. 2_MG-2023]MDO6782072.1 tripartite tricarboxylate transporter TctB family protein [Marinovum sp. 1_MG-2023]
MTRDEQAFFALLAIGSAVFYFVIIPWQIADPDWATVSPRLMPQICAIGIFVLSLYKLATSLKIAIPEFSVSARSYGILAVCIAIPTLAALAMVWIGFWIPAAVMVAACLLLTGTRNPLTVIAFSVGLTGATWFLLDLAGLYVS